MLPKEMTKAIFVQMPTLKNNQMYLIITADTIWFFAFFRDLIEKRQLTTTIYL